MQKTGEFLYLARADVEKALPSPAEAEAAIEAAFRGLADGSTECPIHSRLDTVPGTFFQAMPARVDRASSVGVKWVCVAPNADCGRPELPHINALIVLNDLETSVVEAVMDGDLITALRPAMVSLVGARRLARADSSRIGFVACGVQARAHFSALKAAFPLSQATCYSRSAATAEAFAGELRRHGMEARVATVPRDSIAGQDIVVTSVPRSKGLQPYLDPDWLEAGSCVLAPDLARCWFPDRIREMDVMVTDSHEASREAADVGRIPWKGEYDAQLSELVCGSHPGRQKRVDRAFFIHPGLGLGDIAIAALVLRRARTLGLGTKLPR